MIQGLRDISPFLPIKSTYDIWFKWWFHSFAVKVIPLDGTEEGMSLKWKTKKTAYIY